jgi:hypothetical protein
VQLGQGGSRSAVDAEQLKDWQQCDAHLPYSTPKAIEVAD